MDSSLRQFVYFHALTDIRHVESHNPDSEDLLAHEMGIWDIH
jgi:hypothetical protein